MPVLDGKEITSLAQMTEAFEQNPSLGKLTLKTEAQWSPDGFSSRVLENPVMKGSGGQPMYAEELLDVLAKCLAYDALGHSGAHGIEIQSLHVQVEGDIDFAGSVGLDAPAGFTELRMRIQIETEPTPAELDRLAQTVQRVSIVARSLSGVPQRFELTAKKTAKA